MNMEGGVALQGVCQANAFVDTGAESVAQCRARESQASSADALQSPLHQAAGNHSSRKHQWPPVHAGRCRAGHTIKDTGGSSVRALTMRVSAAHTPAD